MEDEKPSTKHLVLKPREVVPMDKLARDGDGTTISVRLIHEQNRIAEEKSSRRKGKESPFPAPAAEPEPALPPVFRPKEIAPLDPPSHPGDQEAIHVPELLLTNRIAEQESGWGQVGYRKRRKSRRTRDFLISVGSLDLLIAGIVCATRNQVAIILGTFAITLITSMIAWIMFFIMDDY